MSLMKENPLDKRKDCLVEIFDKGVTNFKPYFLSPTWSILNNFCAHKKVDFLRFSKLTLLPKLSLLDPIAASKPEL